MTTLPGYQFVEELHRSQTSVVCRLRRESDRKAFIAKFLINPSPSPLEIASFRHEVRITQHLDAAGAPKFYKAVDETGLHALLIEDFEGVPLDKYASGKALTLDRFLKIAGNIAEVLQHLHESQLIHKDIKPSNILVKPQTLEVEVIDFGIASSRRMDVIRSGGEDIAQGTLQYMSPEQTGRINRNIDHRTDLYSFGVLLYELATGRLPFKTDDMLELVHAHIAIVPEPPQHHAPALPTAVSDIIMKLLAKSADDRYRSAVGLLHDLRRVEADYYKSGIIIPFALGEYDFDPELGLPQKLYGRKAEVQVLNQAYERSLTGKLVRVFISGNAGVGKSVLVDELKKTAISQRSYFLEGKFDQFNHGVAYSAILSLLNNLIEQVLKEPDDKLTQLADTLKENLGKNLGLMVELLPKLSLIVGNIPPPPTLTAKESENRFKITFRAFIRTFIKGEKSIVAFVDDVQWADYASLNLLHWLAKNTDSGRLMMVYAYRKEAINQNSAFQKWLIDMMEVSRDTETIELYNLELAEVEDMIHDLLKTEKNRGELAELLMRKTDGNPFFIIEILRAIKDKQLIRPKQTDGKFEWQIDIQGIKKLNFTDNVIDLILSRVGRISQDCVKVLRSASCVNIKFTLDTLLALHPDIDRSEMEELLGEAMQADLIQPDDERFKYVGLADVEIDASYAFIHDRVQQAIYSSINETELEKTHFKLALDGLSRKEATQEQLMETASNINKALDLFRGHELAIPAAGTLVSAAQKAKENNSPNIDFLHAALELLPENAWQIMPDLAFGAHLLLAESFFLLGRNEESEHWYVKTEEDAHSPAHKAIAICLKMVLYIYSGRYADGISEGHRALGLLGYNLPEANDENIGATLGYVMQLLGDRAINSLSELNPATDEQSILVNNVMSVLLPSAFLASNGNLWTLCVLDMTKLLLERGLTVGGAVGLSSFGMIMGNIIGDKNKALAIGEVALDITAKLGDHSRDAQLKFVIGAFLSTWINNNTEIQKWLDSAMTDGLQYGDLPYIGYSFQVKLGVSVYMATPFADMLEIIEKHKSLIHTLGQPDALVLTGAFERILRQEFEPNAPLKPAPPVSEMVGEFLQSGQYQAAGLTLHFSNVIHILHRNYQAVVENQAIINQLAQAFFSNIMLVSQRVFYVIAKANLAANLEDKEEKAAALAEIKELISTTQSENQGANHFFMNALVMMEAMAAWLEKGEDALIESLEKVLTVAQETSNYRSGALASEMLCRIFSKRNKITLAKAYLADALKNYTWYGANSKVALLRQEMHHLITEISETESFTSTMTSMGMDQRLDYLSIIRSSQILSAETDINKLLHEFLKICHQNAGAQRGLVLLLQDKLEVRANFGYKEKSITYPELFVKYVQRTGEMVASGNAEEDEKFATEAYFKQNKTLSAIAAPVKYKGKLKGVIYLENNLTKGAFGKAVQQILSLLTNQIAISIENASLYANLEESNKNLEQKVRERTAELSTLYVENERLLLNMLPPSIAQRLKSGETYISDLHGNVSVLFTDIENFTQISEKLTPKELVAEIHEMFKSFDAIMEKYGIEKIKTIGDAYLAVSGLPYGAEDHAHRLIYAAREILELVAANRGNNGIFNIRIGISSGPVVAGVVGVKKFAYDIWGDTVNTAARMEQYSEPGKINISGATYALINGDFTCTYRGKIEAKNKGEIDMYFVE